MSIASVATYVWGQCTAFVAGALNWVPGGLGNAKDWPVAAKNMGYPVGNIAHVNDAVVWPSGYAGAGGNGHVARVTAVNPNGSIGIAEQNWSGGVGVTDTRVIGPDIVKGLTFISPKGTQQSSSGGILGIDLNPMDALSGAVTNFTGVVQKGAVNLGLYTGFFLLAIVLIFVGLLFMVFSTNVGRDAAKGAALAAVK